MKEIVLPSGVIAIVSDEDYPNVAKYSWCARTGRTNRTSYAKSFIDGKLVYMHRFIMNAPIGSPVDHIDGNGLNNQRENLRFATNSQNQCSRKFKRHGTSKFWGVTNKLISRSDRKWTAQIYHEDKGRSFQIGQFEDEECAAWAYDVHAILKWGEFATVNLPDLGWRDLLNPSRHVYPSRKLHEILESI